MPKGFRGLRFEHTFEAEFEVLEPDATIRDELMLGVEMILCRKPESGFTEGHGVWVKELSDPSRKRRFQIYYTFNDEMVFLLHHPHGSIRHLARVNPPRRSVRIDFTPQPSTLSAV